MNITIGTKFQLNLIIFTFWTKFAQKGISGRKRKNRTCACVHGRYLLYKTFPHRGRQTKRYFNVSSPFSYRNNNCQIDWLYKSLKRIWSKNAEKFKFCCEYCEIFKRIKEFPRISWVTMEVESFSTDLLQTGRGGGTFVLLGVVTTLDDRCRIWEDCMVNHNLRCSFKIRAAFFENQNFHKLFFYN